MSDDDECKHGLDPAWCAACKEGPKRNEPERVDYTFRAKYEGQCPECDLPITLGQAVAKTTRGRVLHGWCAT